MSKMADLDVWGLAAKVQRIDAEVGALWKALRQQGISIPNVDQGELFSTILANRVVNEVILSADQGRPREPDPSPPRRQRAKKPTQNPEQS